MVLKPEKCYLPDCHTFFLSSFLMTILLLENYFYLQRLMITKSNIFNKLIDEYFFSFYTYVVNDWLLV